MLHQALAANPQLRVLGQQESRLLYQQILHVEPLYTQVYNLLARAATNVNARYGERAAQQPSSMFSL